MRIQFWTAVALSIAAIPVLAQTTAPPAPTILYASPAEAAAVLAKAKSLPTMVSQFLVASGGYSARIEHRKVSTPGSVHEKDDEFLEVMEAAGTITVGGALKDKVRRDAWDHREADPSAQAGPHLRQHRHCHRQRLLAGAQDHGLADGGVLDGISGKAQQARRARVQNQQHKVQAQPCQHHPSQAGGRHRELRG